MGKHPESGKDSEQEEKEGTEDEMVWWHHRLKGHESEQTLGDGEEQGNLECCSPWGCKESDTTEQVNNKNNLYENITLYTLKRYHFLGGVFCVALLIGRSLRSFHLGSWYFYQAPCNFAHFASNTSHYKSYSWLQHFVESFEFFHQITEPKGGFAILWYQQSATDHLKLKGSWVVFI